jgi:hypothetical protein
VRAGGRRITRRLARVQGLARTRRLARRRRFAYTRQADPHAGPAPHLKDPVTVR